MTKSTVLSLTACLSSILSLVSCSDKSATTPCNPGDPGCSAVAGNSSTGGATKNATTSSSASSGGTSSTGGVTSAGGTTANATTAAAGGSSATGGTTAKATTGNTGGSSSAVGGKTSTGGTSAAATSAVGGKTSTGGTSAVATSAVGGKTSTPTGGTSAVATSAVGGKTSSGGSSSAAGGTAATGGSSVTATGGSTAPTTDEGGKALAKPGDKTGTANDYLNLGNVRLINNNWGSQALGSSCNAPQSVEVKSDGSFGWTFNRGNCGDNGAHPDYPELEFGVAPFGKTHSLRTSPAFSTTTLLPIRVSEIQSASVSIGNFSIQLNSNTNWNLNIEFWLSKLDPLTNNDAQAYLEIMGMWGWSAGADQWKCDASGNVTSSGKNYSLCHQSDAWGGDSSGNSKWRFFQFKSGPSLSFSGNVDIKAFLDWFYGSNYGSGVSKDYYLTRIELGTEIADSTSGSCTLSNVTFTINGTAQTATLGK